MGLVSGITSFFINIVDPPDRHDPARLANLNSDGVAHWIREGSIDGIPFRGIRIRFSTKGLLKGTRVRKNLEYIRRFREYSGIEDIRAVHNTGLFCVIPYQDWREMNREGIMHILIDIFRLEEVYIKKINRDAIEIRLFTA